MKTEQPTWAVFTKPWPLHPAQELADVVTGLGFTGIELPVRGNTRITPKHALSDLPDYVSVLRDRGVETISIAADLSEETFAACQAAGVPLIRIMVAVTGNDFVASLQAARKKLSEAASWAKTYGVGVAIQPHRGPYVTSCLGVLNLLEGLWGEHFSVVWDAAHDALAGEDPVTTLKLVQNRLSIANFKNVIYTNGGGIPPGRGRTWEPWYVPGAEGLADWDRAFGQLRQQRFGGPICLTAQYSGDNNLEEQLRNDLRYAQTLWQHHTISPQKGN